MKTSAYLRPLRGHAPALDLLRGYGLHMPFVGHAAHFANLIHSQNPLDRFLVYFITHGWVGVELFFVLSGFLITSLLINERRRFGAVDIKKFYMRRALRVFPLYYFYLILIFFVLPIVGVSYLQGVPLSAFFQYFFYCHFLVPAAVTKNELIGHLWTLSIEEQYYLLWPLTFCLVRPRLAVGILLGSIALSTGLKIYLYYAVQFDYYWHSLLPTRCESLAVGTLGAFALNSRIRILRKKSTYWFLLLVCGGIFLGRNLGPRYFSNWHTTENIYAYLVLAIAIFSFMVLFMDWTKRRRVFSREKRSFPPVFLGLFLGKISYGIYIYHMLVIKAFDEFYRHYIPYTAVPGTKMWVTPQWALYVILPYLVTVFIAHMSFRYFENPLLRMKRRYSREG